jgi:hypothetical protein
MASSKRRDIWGFAVGFDHNGDRRRIAVYKTGTGFDFVSETLFCHSVSASGKPSPEFLRAQVVSAFGLNDLKFEFPHLGIFASAPVEQAQKSALSTRRFSSR